jgi:hypothetical protein
MVSLLLQLTLILANPSSFILISVVLLCVGHPGVYASALQDGKTRPTYKAVSPLHEQTEYGHDVEYRYELDRV